MEQLHSPAGGGGNGRGLPRERVLILMSRNYMALELSRSLPTFETHAEVLSDWTTVPSKWGVS